MTELNYDKKQKNADCAKCAKHDIASFRLA